MRAHMPGQINLQLPGEADRSLLGNATNINFFKKDNDIPVIGRGGP
jgi:hypothetical protein